MKILIIEDELPAARRLRSLIAETHPQAEILEVLDSVEGAVAWLKTESPPELIFMDIQLADGMSFDIFNHTQVNAPVIFTTAFDQYALKAFKVNSIDYLLKPIDPEELHLAFDKFERHYQSQATSSYDYEAIHQLMQQMVSKNYKERFLVKMGQQLSYLKVTEIAYFYSEGGLVHALDQKGKRHIIDFTLDQLEEVIRPDDFFRINRKIITGLKAIQKIHTYFNSRLKLELQPTVIDEVIVSRDRVNDFKQWLDK